MKEGESLGAASFQLEELFDQTAVIRVFIHVAINFKCTDNRFSLFWGAYRTQRWIQCEFVLH